MKLQRFLGSWLILALLLAAPVRAQVQHPFGGDVFDLNAELEAVRTGSSAAARKLAGERFLETLYRDPYLAKLGPSMQLERWVSDLVDLKPFDASTFRAAGKRAIEAGGAGSADVGVAELQQKLEVLEMAFSTPGSSGAPRLPVEALESHRLAKLLGTKQTRVMSMQPVPGARVLQVSETVSLPAGESSEAVALELFGRMLAPVAAGRGGSRPGLAHREVGRAVLGPQVSHPGGASTSDVLKGVGPTPWANTKNRFNSKATGTFPLPEAVRDWQKTEILRKAGVAVYEPVAIVALPYMEWSKSEGWRPIAVYVRRARENLRVSDLDHLSRSQKRKLVAELKLKIEAELQGVGRGEGIAEVDVIRSFVERMGRTAGLFQGGMVARKSGLSCEAGSVSWPWIGRAPVRTWDTGSPGSAGSLLGFDSSAGSGGTAW